MVAVGAVSTIADVVASNAVAAVAAAAVAAVKIAADLATHKSFFECQCQNLSLLIV